MAAAGSSCRRRQLRIALASTSSDTSLSSQPLAPARTMSSSVSSSSRSSRRSPAVRGDRRRRAADLAHHAKTIEPAAYVDEHDVDGHAHASISSRFGMIACPPPLRRAQARARRFQDALSDERLIVDNGTTDHERLRGKSLRPRTRRRMSGAHRPVRRARRNAPRMPARPRCPHAIASTAGALLPVIARAQADRRRSAVMAIHRFRASAWRAAFVSTSCTQRMIASARSPAGPRRARRRDRGARRPCRARRPGSARPRRADADPRRSLTASRTPVSSRR